MVEVVEYWTHFLYGHKFEIVTDHKALCYLMTSTHHNRRLRGLAMRLLSFDFQVEYRPGSCNDNADGLS